MRRTFRVGLSNPWLWAALLSSVLCFGGKGRAQETGPDTDRRRPGAADHSMSAEQRRQFLESYGRLPLHFVANQGQKDAEVRFYAQGGGRALFFTRKGVSCAWRESGNPAPRGTEGREWGRPEARKSHRGSPSRSIQLLPLRMRPEVELMASEPLEWKVNLFQGKDPARWFTDIPTCGAVVYREAYPGIDLKFYGNGGQVEYDVIVRPGADPGRVKFQCRGTRSLKLKANGDLAIKLPGGGELVQKKPLIYQEIGGRRVIREGGFKLARSRESCRYGFNVAAYDKNHPLIIDPVLVYATYLGGRFDDFGYGIAVDSAGCTYVTGKTHSDDDFPTQNPLQILSKGLTDAFVAKLSAPGNSLIYATYLGGSNWDAGLAIAMDSAGCAYVTGETFSNDFPIKNALQGQLKGEINAFVAKLSAQGNSLVYSTYLGGSFREHGRGIVVDSAGCAYVTGTTGSSDFPTQNPLQTEVGASFVTKLSSLGDALVYSTYLGKSYTECKAIAVDQAGCAYLTGTTGEYGFPTKNPLQAQYGGGSFDAFVTKLSAAGDALVYSTYLGGYEVDFGCAIAVDPAGCACVTGYTQSGDFPTRNPLQAQIKGYYDAFVAKFAAGGNELVYSTYLGGSDFNEGYGIAVDPAGCAYVTGYTSSDDFPTQNPLQAQRKGGRDAYVAKLSTGGDALVYSTYLGGSSSDYGYGIAVDSAGCTYVTGKTASTDFPTRNPFQAHLHRNYDAFVAKIGNAPLPNPGKGLVPVGTLLLD